MGLRHMLDKYAAVNSKNFEKRFGDFLASRNELEILRFQASLDELENVKATLVAKYSNNPMIGYQVAQGLGAICITCVEEHVTRILTRNGFCTEIHAREFPEGLWESGLRRPSIHAYNVVRVCGSDFVVDLDTDPFVGQNVGTVIVPVQTSIPMYSCGFLYHRRSVSSSGGIAYYECSYEDDSRQPHMYLEGDIADYLTIAPYHGLSDESLCPLCLARGATLYFGFEKYYIGGSKAKYRIPLVLVCPVFPGDKERTYQISFSDVRHIRVRRQEVPVGGRGECESVLINVVLSHRRQINILLASGGTLIANDSVSFVQAERTSNASLKVWVGAAEDQSVKIVLPMLPRI